ncbi:uncharacterized protein BT62DRAFT_938720, partial [Guyanagaster necrorhizus]
MLGDHDDTIQYIPNNSWNSIQSLKRPQALERAIDKALESMADMKTTTAMEIRDLGHQLLANSPATSKWQGAPNATQTYASITKNDKDKNLTQKPPTVNPMDLNHHSRLVNLELAKHDDSKHICVTTV